MMKRFTITLPLGILLGFLFFGFHGCKTSEERYDSLKGVYADPKPYAYGKAFGHRTFQFDSKTWTLDFTLSLDPEGKLPVFSFRTYGNYKIGNASPVVPGAVEALFTEEKKFLTLHTREENLIRAFGFQNCNLRVGIESDISEKGCSAWAPISVCNEDHDLLLLSSDGGLQFGERPMDNNMCTRDRRPKSLTPAVYPRVKI